MAAIAVAPAAHAGEDQGWRKGDLVVSVGVAAILFDSTADIKLAGNPVAGGNVKLSNNTILSGSIEYFLARQFSLAFVAGIPPQTKVTGTGSLAPLGELGRVRYGLGSLVARYHFNASGRFSPYISAGASRFMVFGTKDGSVTNLNSEDAWAPVLQAGVDYHLSRHIGLFANATYIPVKTKASGTSRGLPMTAEATLKATLLKGGVAYRF
jgi:outer membrane protein